jgi:hypothetical protein
MNLYDPTLDVRPDYDLRDTYLLKEGNHHAMIIEAELLEPTTNAAGEVYQQLQLQWETADGGQIRQKLIAQHKGEATKAANAMRMTSQIVGDMKRAVNPDFADVISDKNFMQVLGHKIMAIQVRNNSGGYPEVKYISKDVKYLPPVPMPKAEVTMEDIEDQIASIMAQAD